MRIKYDIYTIENSQGDGSHRQFVRIQQPGAMTEEELCQEVHDRCTATAADVKAVMSAIREIAQRELSRGSRFYLPEIGYLSLSVGLKPRAGVSDGELADGAGSVVGNASNNDGNQADGSSASTSDSAADAGGDEVIGTGDGGQSDVDTTAAGGGDNGTTEGSDEAGGTGRRKITGNDVCVRGLNFKPEARFLRRVKQSVTFERTDLATHSPRYDDAKLWARVEAYAAENGYIDRPSMQRAFGLSGYMARKWLKVFADSRRLVRRGSTTRPVYTLPSNAG